MERSETASVGSLHELFLAACRRTPEATALVAGGTILSYRDLDRRADALARRLSALGVHVETPVAVRLGRSPDLVIALLGVLKAGGVYVPIEPATPRHRCRLMLADSAAGVLVTRGDTHDPAVTGAVAHLVMLDVESGGPGAGVRPDPDVHPDNLAYITFTSGSTGRPKAVATTHRSAVGYLRYLAEAGHLTPRDTTLQLAAPSFDASIRDILGPLTVGARIVQVPDELVSDADALQDLMERHAVTCVPALIPATLRLLCGSARPVDRDRLRLRRLLVSGEVLTGAAVQLAHDRLGADVEVVNHYGPTECTMTSTFHLVDGTGSNPAPVGRPPSGSRVYLLDHTLSAVPAGAVGEIYIAGAGVARGYLNRPALTAGRFLPDPFGEPGARMYRTGDLGRFDADGVLEFHGRVDAQLNVNGVRIEPGEVEVTLQAHESVAEAAVAAVQASRGGSVLVGYVVARPGRVIDTDGLREFARSRLPHPFVPRTFIPLPALPRTDRGKLDRAALHARPPTPRATDARQPRTGEEAAILAICRDILHRPDLGLHDDLFDVGGDSVLVMSLVARIRRALGRAPALADVFNEPTVAAVARLLPPPPAAGSGTALPGPALPATVPAQMPLSFAQQRLWFFEKLLPGSPLNTIAAAFRVDGGLNVAALSAAVHGTVLRHGALRSTFGLDGGQPTCRLREVVEPPFEVVRLPPDEHLTDRADALARLPLDIERGPLLSVTLLDAAPAGRLLLVRLHHLVGDARSLEILLDDISEAYQARRAGHVHELSPPTHPYPQYVAWQRGWLTDEQAARHLAFWRTELAGAPPLLELPTDRPRPPVQRYRGAVYYRTVRPDHSAAATTLGRVEGASRFMVLLTVWAAVLSRYAGQDDLVIGVPVTGRSQPEFDRTVGMFVNTLPVRIRLTGAPTFRQLLCGVRDATFRALAHRDFPFEQLVEHLRPARSTAYGPVFQALADLQRAPSPRLPGAAVTPVGVDTGTARFDVSLSFLVRDTGVVGAYTYSTDLFEPATVERMAGHFETLLAGALATPDRAVDALLLLEGAQWRALTTPRRGMVRARYTSVPDRIADQARRRPDGVAVTCGHRRLTYAGLDQASAHVAGRLADLGVGAETLVGICAERSPELVAGLVGIHRAGGAYLPLDPAHPADRLAALVADARPAVVLAQPHLLDSLRPRVPAILSLQPLEAATATATAAPWARLRGDQLAYTIYTSGSTGTPKGVEVTHAGLAHVLSELAELIDITPDDTLVAVTTLAFDIAALEIFLPLMTGARVVLATRSVAADPVTLCALLRAERATVLQATPTTWQLLSDQRPPPSLRVALCGGEALPPPLAGDLPRLARSAFNVYGPTETTIWSTIARLDGAAGPISIGEPIGDTTVLVLDERLEPVPAGVTGEIYLGGAGVARGYRSRPELTAARFLPDPYAAAAGARIYRTGDRGRRHPDGRLEYLGRVDRQIKLRGFRIEPAEVERVLQAHPSVRRAVVTVRPDAGEQPQLVAYVVLDGALDADLLRGFLAERLPQYLVPAVIVELDALPLTANGKIDVNRLPAPHAARPRLSTEFSRATTDTENALAAIWADVLAVDRVGVDDDFFDLGGHSLRAIQVMSRVNDTFGADLELYVLFAERTVRGLARRLARGRPPASASDEAGGTRVP
jgi:amino acid adenylation domain-containing protein